MITSVAALLTSCTECGSRAVLYKYPHDLAGLWECTNPDCGASDTCEHPERRTENIQVDFWPTADIDQSYERPVYVCEACDSTIDLDIADPLIDQAEAAL